MTGQLAALNHLKTARGGFSHVNATGAYEGGDPSLVRPA